MQTAVIVNAANWNFKEDLTQIEYYGTYAFVAEAFNYAAEETFGTDDGISVYSADEIETLFGIAPSEGCLTCTNHVLWPGFEHLGPVDYFTLTDNHIVCAVFITDDEDGRSQFTYLRLN